LRHPDRSLAFSRLWSWLATRDRDSGQDFPPSPCTDERAVSCLLHAGWVGDNTSDARRSDALHRTVLVQVIQPLHLFFVTTLTQVSRVSMGPGFDSQPRSARRWCSLSAGFPPYPLPRGNAGRSTLTPLSSCSSFRAICTSVKWRTRTQSSAAA